MNQRLKTIEDMVPYGRGLIDVGSDHGYLPLSLAQNAYPGMLFASDINELPLQSAERAAKKAGMEDRIRFLLCDGLDACPPEQIDCIVIAGMGGDLICRILDRAEWCMNSAYTLLLQPMTKAEVLRYWLVNNGYTLTEERLVRDGFLYQIIKAEFSGNMPLTDAELFSGALRNICGDPLAAEHLAALTLRFEKEIRGLRQSAEPDSGKLALCRTILSQLEKMKGELL